MNIPNEPLYTEADMQEMKNERDHWKSVARQLIRTYRVDDQAWSPEENADLLLAGYEMAQHT